MTNIAKRLEEISSQIATTSDNEKDCKITESCTSLNKCKADTVESKDDVKKHMPSPVMTSLKTYSTKYFLIDLKNMNTDELCAGLVNINLSVTSNNTPTIATPSMMSKKPIKKYEVIVINENTDVQVYNNHRQEMMIIKKNKVVEMIIEE
ncbi:predicted protein [Histoplasma capsulatum var. duboisii H88]|uniref:Predicted protein n=1 Tax=Ajellomyces capsulatus (strain H88) TaxID=544711 RepID=F0UT09_AJEC8|nr:predicted protein [Histoplasma capsulatum var. duboisii H88]